MYDEMGAFVSKAGPAAPVQVRVRENEGSDCGLLGWSKLTTVRPIGPLASINIGIITSVTAVVLYSNDI